MGSVISHIKCLGGSALASLLAVLCTGSVSVAAELVPVDTRPVEASIVVDANTDLGRFNPRRIGGTNVALWNDPDHFKDPQLHKWISDMRPGYIRIPGGSWSNAHYWNGNGVRGEDGKINHDAVGADGYPAVDYSAYKPGFNVDTKTLHPSKGYHGNVDVKTLQDWVISLPGAELMPCLNAGTGRPVDAAEWVKWNNTTNKQYRSTIWEIGNELGGSWEPGNFLPDGSGMTGEIFAQRYGAIAVAMRKVAPSIKIGACTFTSHILRDCGDLVDFIAIHTYPGTTSRSFRENLAELPGVISREVGTHRDHVKKHQPSRENEIELGYTEWNLAGGMNASDLFSGLWHSLALAEMARNGVDFATQWDIFTHTRGMSSGHGLIFTDNKDNVFVRKSAYYAMWMWNNFTGTQALKSELTEEPQGERPLHMFTSRDDKAVYLQLINPDENRPLVLKIDLKNFDPAARGERVTLSSRHYFWNPTTHLPLWSRRPNVETIDVAQQFTVELPPFSATHLRIPSAASPALSEWAGTGETEESAGTPRLELILPDEVYAGDRTPAWLVAYAADQNAPYTSSTIAPATLSAEGQKVVFDRPAARLTESISSFTFVAPEAGEITLAAQSGDVRVHRKVKVKSSEPRPVVLWDFRNPKPDDAEAFKSEFSLVADDTVRANKHVARVDLPAEGVIPSEKDKTRALLIVNSLPPREKLNRANIRGVVFDLMTRNVQTDDPDAAVVVVMQSPANWWMVLGRVPLAGQEKWASHSVALTNEKFIGPIASSYNIWFVLQSRTPVKGSVYLDRIGFMVR